MVNHKAGGGKARGKEGDWTMKLWPIPGAAVSPLATQFPPILFSLALPIYINIKEHYSLPCGTWTRAGWWPAHRSAGKWLQRRVHSVAHSPWTWAQGSQVGRNPTLQPLSVHLLLYCSQEHWLLQGGKYRANFCIILSGICFLLPKNDRLPHGVLKILLIYWSNNKKENESCV